MSPAFEFRNWFGKIKNSVLIALLGAAPLGAFSQYTEWLPDQSGPWSDGQNWSFGVPTPTATVIITNGGTSTLNDAEFTARYNLLHLGSGGGQSGAIALSDGVLEGNEARLGQAAGSSGSVVVGGGTWNQGNLFVGDGGQGTLTVTGGWVSGQDVTLGWNAGASGSATVSGGTWNHTALSVGHSGQGTLNLQGGQISSTVATLGVAAGGEGTATVSGGVWDTTIDIYLGLEGAGTLEITSGTVSAGQHVYLGLGSGHGTLNLDGGVLATRQVAQGSGTGSVRFQGGTLRALADQANFLAFDAAVQEAGARIDSNGFAVGIGTALSGSGGLTKLGEGTLTLSGTNSYAGGTVVQSGTLVIGNGVISHALADTVVGTEHGGTAGLRLEGGLVENQTTRFAAEAGATGVAIVETGTWNVGGDFVVGEVGSGTLSVAGGIVTVGGTTTLGAQAGSSGALNLSGGVLSTMRVVQGEGDAIITLNGGTLRATTSQAEFISGDVTIGAGGAHIDTGVHTLGLEALTGSGGLSKWGTGTLILSGSNTYAGSTTVQSGTLVIGSGVSVSHNAADVVVGGANATMLISDGQVASHSGHIGSDVDSTGIVQMTGGVWTNVSDLYVGDNGTGSLSLVGGAVVSSASGILGAYQGSAGAVTVTSGTWQMSNTLFVGQQGKGSLLVNGGYVSADTSYVGYQVANAGGAATVTSGTWQTAGNLFVAHGTSGTLTVDGGLVTADYIALGANGGHGVVTVSSGTLTSATDLDIADAGLGASELIVQGGFVSNGTARLGSSATASVTSGTWHNAAVLDVGNGRLNISGGEVQSHIGRIGHSGGGGQAEVTGGVWVTGELAVGYDGTGSLTVASGGQVYSQTAVIGSGADGGTVMVTGEGSQFIILDTLTVGDLGSDNKLVVRDGALVKVGDSLDETIVFSLQGGSDNLLLLDAGYVALFGNQTAYVEDVLLANGRIEMWDGAGWVTAAGNPDFQAVYYATDAEAFAATGYEHLGGYTVLTTVPEPTAPALILLGLGAFLSRRGQRSVRA
jgi:autotransporter-associated beta strand protein/T5SS/PEP-CTERM-associated repeat protein